jgi:hypothetical protein
VHRPVFFVGGPASGRSFWLCVGLQRAFAARARLLQVRRGLACFCGRPASGRSFWALSRRAARIRREGAPPTGSACTALFLWEARPRGEAFGFALACSAHSPRGRASYRFGVHRPVFCGRPALGAKLLALRWLAARIRREGAPPTVRRAPACFCGRPVPGAKLLALRWLVARIRREGASPTGLAWMACFCGRPAAGAKLFVVVY